MNTSIGNAEALLEHCCRNDSVESQILKNRLIDDLLEFNSILYKLKHSGDY